MSTPAASARGVSMHFGATRALDDVDFEVHAGRAARAGRRERGRQIDAGAHPRGGASARSRRDRGRRAPLPLQRSPRRHCGRGHHHPAGTAARPRAVGCREPDAWRSAGAPPVGPPADRSRADAQCGASRACAARLCARSRRPGRPIELCRTPARRHRQGAATAMPGPGSRRTHRRPGDARDRAAVRRPQAHEEPRHGDHLCFAPARRGGRARRPLHRAARRPGCGDKPARRLQGRRFGRGDDRPRRGPWCLPYQTARSAGGRARPAPCCWKTSWFGPTRFDCAPTR